MSDMGAAKLLVPHTRPIKHAAVSKLEWLEVTVCDFKQRAVNT
jgi:hypothetical protein